MSQEFGAYFQCYKQPMATYKCLESFRKHYPNNTIVLLSDNGYNYSKMAEYFNCIYIHSYENIPLCNKDLSNDTYIKNVNKIIERFKTAFNLIKENYVMWLEDDVYINSKVTDILRYDIDGWCQAIERIIGDKAYRELLRQNGFRRVKEIEGEQIRGRQELAMKIESAE